MTEGGKGRSLARWSLNLLQLSLLSVICAFAGDSLREPHLQAIPSSQFFYCARRSRMASSSSTACKSRGRPMARLATMRASRLSTRIFCPSRSRGSLADRKSLLALRGVGPEFEAGSLDFYARMLPDGALRVKCPAFWGAGRAPHPKMPGLARGLAGNASLQGAPCRCRGSQFSANTGSLS